MEPRIQAKYTVVDDVNTLWEKLASTYKSKLKINIFEIWEDLWNIKVQDCRDFDNYSSQIDLRVKDNNLCAAPSTTDTDVDTAKTIAKMSEQEHIIYLLRGIPTNDEWKVIRPLVMDTDATMTAMPERIVTKLVEEDSEIKREHGLAPDALLFVKKGGRGGNGGDGGNGGKAGTGGRSPKRDKRGDKRDNKHDNKEKDFRQCSHCHREGTPPRSS
jgi:hypothetical protein